MSNEIKITCDTKLSVPLENLVPFQGELKTLSEVNYQKLKKQILDEGFCAPVFVWKNDAKYYLCDGHQRTITLNKMKSEGYKVPDVPAVEIQAKTKREAKKKLLSYVSQFGKVDPKGLYQYILDAELTIEEMDDFEIPEIDLEDFKEEFFPEDKPVGDGSEDEIPEIAQNELGVKLGDIFELGNHRLMCGDSTDLATVEKLMNGEKADVVYTDPPYGMSLDVNYDGMFSNDKGHKKKGDRFSKVIGDESEFDPSPILKVKANDIFLWGADYFYDKLPKGGSWSAWDKRSETMDAVIGNTTEFLWSKNPHRRMTARVLWSGHHGMGKDDEKTRVHPTQKPIKLHEWFFDNYCNKHKIILDLFLGSGSTLIACEKTNRKCYGSELDPHYCSVIIKRYIQYVGSDKGVYLIDGEKRTHISEVQKMRQNIYAKSSK